jgi:hypothetical protein
MLPLLLLAAQATEPRSPPVITAPPAPMLVSPAREPIAPSQLDVRVTAGRELLWEGSLRVGVTGGTYRQDLTQAPEEPCLSGSPNGLQLRSGFVVSITRLRYGRPSNQHQLTVNWSRPSDSESCTNNGARTVELRQTINLDPGQEVTLEGDAGLSVRIRRTG